MRAGRGQQGLQVESLTEKGRLAELAGDREGAIRAYAEYLRYRTRPQGVFVEGAEAIRARLAALTSENASRDRLR